MNIYILIMMMVVPSIMSASIRFDEEVSVSLEDEPLTITEITTELLELELVSLIDSGPIEINTIEAWDPRDVEGRNTKPWKRNFFNDRGGAEMHAFEALRTLPIFSSLLPRGRGALIINSRGYITNVDQLLPGARGYVDVFNRISSVAVRASQNASVVPVSDTEVDRQIKRLDNAMKFLSESIDDRGGEQRDRGHQVMLDAVSRTYYSLETLMQHIYTTTEARRQISANGSVSTRNQPISSIERAWLRAPQPGEPGSRWADVASGRARSRDEL